MRFPIKLPKLMERFSKKRFSRERLVAQSLEQKYISSEITSPQKFDC